ncbi:PAS domain S-box protein [Ancylothrix sp. C2]|uniref:PAS domain S-box protein n=1 Tax=Ancylothrix sp. D3o TaxID=2953691 RepID=UPI0021BB94C3|nr:PAS domain S-box protein [Ancylothrix sp. D3o]MCT7951748.1 PAS domain S-box protein [Ancylothrix sp. D3o]
MTTVFSSPLTRTSLKVLLVENNLSEANLIEKLILENNTENFNFSVFKAGGLSEALNLLGSQNFDVILLELTLPDSQGTDTIARIKEHYLNIPLIILISQITEEIAVQIIAAGAQDYLSKEEINSPLLKRTLRCAIERQKLQTTNRQSEEKYRSALDHIKEIVFQTDCTGHWTFLNPAWSEITNFSVAESLGTEFLTYIHPEDQAKNRENFQALIQNKKQQCRFSTRYRTKTGNYRWLEVQVRQTHSLDNTLTGTTGTLSDITTQVIANEKIKASKDFLNHILNAISDPLFVKDAQHRWIKVNDAFCQLLGQPRTEILSKTDHHFLPKQQADIFWEKDELVLTTGIENENEEIITDTQGNQRIVSTKKTLFINPDGSKMIVGIMRDITHYKQTLAALENSEQKFQKLAANAPGMLYQFRLTTEGKKSFPYVSPSSRELYGLEPEEIIQDAETLFQGIHPEDRPGLENSIIQSATTQQPWQYEWRHITPTGKHIWTKAASRPQTQPNGDILWDGLIIDITELKQTQADRDRFFTLSLDLLCIADLDGTVLRLNPACQKIFGYTEQELQSKPLIELIHPDDQENTIKAAKKLRSGENITYFENRCLCKDGTYKWLSWVSVPYAEEGCAYAVARDITEQKKAELELQISQKRLQLALEGSDLGLCDWNIATGETYYDPQWKKMLGYQIEEIENHFESWAKLVHPEDLPKAVEAIQDHLAGMTDLYQREFRMKTKTGEWKWILAQGKVCEWDTQNNPLRMTGTHKDITESKQAEIALHQELAEKRIIGKMFERIGCSLNLEEVLTTAVQQVREFLQTDRTLIYRFNSDFSGLVVVESIGHNTFPIVGLNLQINGCKDNYLPLYRKGKIIAIEDINDSSVNESYKNLLAQLQVKANLSVPILQGEKLWGLLIAQDCTAARNWQASQIECLQKISIQIAISLQQSLLFEKAKTEIIERKQAEAALRESETRLRSQTLQLEIALNNLHKAQAKLLQTKQIAPIKQWVSLDSVDNEGTDVSSEIKNPLNFISANLSPAISYCDDLLNLIQLYQQYFPEPPPAILDYYDHFNLDYIIEDLPKLLNAIKRAAERQNRNY